jgi:DNA-binding PadR family transcriptional regulator
MVTTMARRPTNPLALAVLTLLDERPMHPYEMSTTLRERRKGDSIRLNYGSLYSVVESLHRGGLIEAQETSREGRRPERTVYGITPAGRTELVDWLSDLVSTPKKEFTQFEAALSLLGALPPDAALRLLEMRLVTLQMHHRQQSAIRTAIEGFPEIFVIEGDFELTLVEAEIGFVGRLIDRIRSGRLGGLDGWRRLHELRAQDLTPEEIDTRLEQEFPHYFPTGSINLAEIAQRADRPAPDRTAPD